MKKKKVLQKIPCYLDLKTALLRIGLFTLLISGSATLGLLYFHYIKAQRSTDDKYRIIAIMQTSDSKESLKTEYLAELLDLSIDHPTNLYAYNSKEARRKLLASPLIKKAQVVKISPGTIYIDYSVRQPIAFLIDFTNTAIDEEGFSIPFKPFFTPKNLPEIYLGLTFENDKTVDWGTSIQGKKIDLALNVLNYASKHCCSKVSHIQRIDVSKAFASSFGQRAIVIILEDRIEKEKDGVSYLHISPRILRLSVENYTQELDNYLILQSYLLDQESNKNFVESQNIAKQEAQIIDMRLPSLAFIRKVKP